MSLYHSKSSGNYDEIQEMPHKRLKNILGVIERTGEDPQGVEAEVRARITLLEEQYRLENPEEPGS